MAGVCGLVGDEPIGAGQSNLGTTVGRGEGDVDDLRRIEGDIAGRGQRGHIRVVGDNHAGRVAIVDAVSRHAMHRSALRTDRHFPTHLGRGSGRQGAENRQGQDQGNQSDANRELFHRDLQVRYPLCYTDS